MFIQTRIINMFGKYSNIGIYLNIIPIILFQNYSNNNLKLCVQIILTMMYLNINVTNYVYILYYI